MKQKWSGRSDNSLLVQVVMARLKRKWQDPMDARYAKQSCAAATEVRKQGKFRVRAI